MKKLIILITALSLSAFTMLIARTFYVEKASHVTVKGETGELRAGRSLDEGAKIVVDEGGVLVILDKDSGNRWVVRKKYSGKVGGVAKVRKSDLCSTTKAMFYTTYTKPVVKECKKDKKAGVSLIGGSAGSGFGVGLRLLERERIWESDTTYRFLDDIKSDSISFILVE
ncbi:MAG: hypothetical protein IJ626_00940 [Muribaculaceae bacterium]|nr:hypothetical protein [Muribaculaceae bacterium]